MKKRLIVFFLIFFIGVGGLLVGCNETDLSSLQSHISDMQQQITDLQDENNSMKNEITDLQDENKILIQQMLILNETIVNLQNRLNNAEENVDELQSQLAIAVANYNELYDNVYGQTNNYKKVGDTWTYSVDGIKILDFVIKSGVFNPNSRDYFIECTISSYVEGISSLEDAQLGIDFLFYDYSTNKIYNPLNISENIIFLDRNIPDEVRSGLLFVYLGNTIVTIYDMNFVDIAS